MLGSIELPERLEPLTIIETPTFTRLVSKYLDDESYRLLQVSLALNPEKGKIIPGSGGIRKLRWGTEGRGKRGGLRVIYYLHVSQGKVLMLFIYSKSEVGDLTKEQIRILRKVAEEFKTYT